MYINHLAVFTRQACIYHILNSKAADDFCSEDKAFGSSLIHI